MRKRNKLLSKVRQWAEAPAPEVGGLDRATLAYICMAISLFSF